MKTLPLILCAMLFLFSDAAFAGNDEKAMQAYARGDYATALTLAKPLAEHGDVKAQSLLALMYDYGKGVPQNAVQAIAWYRKAALQGDSHAQFEMGMCYETGRSTPIPKDFVQAAEWFRKAAVQRDAGSQYELGMNYLLGEGLPKDDAQAAAWLRKAAIQGIAPAQYTLGVMYDGGMGVTQDHAQADGWYRKAAMQESAEAQWALGGAYFKGDGVPRDFAQAIVWFRKSAAHGNGDAQLNLGWMYANGIGVPQNLESGYALYDLAKATSDPISKMDRQDFQKNTMMWQGVRSRMTPAQLVASESLAMQMQRAGVLQALDARK